MLRDGCSFLTSALFLMDSFFLIGKFGRKTGFTIVGLGLIDAGRLQNII